MMSEKNSLVAYVEAIKKEIGSEKQLIQKLENSKAKLSREYSNKDHHSDRLS